jgi:hypothetical protein
MPKLDGTHIVERLRRRLAELNESNTPVKTKSRLSGGFVPFGTRIPTQQLWAASEPRSQQYRSPSPGA